MKEESEVRRARRERGRVGLTPVTAAIVLGVVVLGVGAASYVVLGAMSASDTHSSTVHSCHPSTAPACAGIGNSTVARDDRGVAVGLPLG